MVTARAATQGNRAAILYARAWAISTLLALVSIARADVVTDIVQENRYAIAYLKVSYEGVPGEPDGKKTVTGSGFVVDRVGHLLTARHVVMPDFDYQKRTISVWLGERGGGNMRHAEPIDERPAFDIALLKMTTGANDYAHVSIGDPDTTAEGSHLTALGFALGEQGAGGVANSDGRLSSKYGQRGTWRTSIPLNPGDSGGPVFEDGNTVVGIVIGGETAALQINAIVPINYATGLLPGPYGGARVPGQGNVGEVPTLVTTIDRPTILDALPAQLRSAPPAGTPGPGYEQELQRKGILKLDGAVLAIAYDAVDQDRTLAVHTLILTRGAKIVTNGMNLRIVATRIVVDDGSISSFASDDARASAPGARGRDGGNVYLIGLRDIAGLLPVSLDGQAGADGNGGPPGVRGSAGRRGDNGADALLGCLRGGGNGDPGQAGGVGGTGQAGGSGGNGGTLFLVRAATGVSTRIAFTASGGLQGNGGPGGAGGPGGSGGQGGRGTAFCRGGSGGADGPPGPAGPRGGDGSAGRNGRMEERA